MPELVETPTELPFTDPSKASCAAARATDVKMRLPGIPGRFDVQFIGTGVATVPTSANKIFNNADPATEVEIEWYQNRFVGKHWLLGEFSVDLAEGTDSTGTIKEVQKSEFGAQIINTNDFYFDFKFKRFPFLNMENVQPIRNSAVISSIPPIGSVYELDAESELVDFRRASHRLNMNTDAPSRKIKFDQCKVTVFPERNVNLSLVKQSKISDNSYEITVKIENPTKEEATFAYFSVVHYKGISTSNDYGFVLLKPGATSMLSYQVSSDITGREIDIPFFAALYAPSKLNGSRSLDLTFRF